MFSLNCKGRILEIDRPIVMGILNITPDSFYEGSRYGDIGLVVEKAGKMLEEGAVILDVGGQTTRPGSERISAEEELSRVIPAIEAIKKNFPESFISVDTYYGFVAREAVAAGASIINDISAGSMDEGMLQVVAELKCPYVLMHMKGTPGTMQLNPEYENVTREVLDFFIERVENLKGSGINDIVIDPGFGFGKSIEQNFRLLQNLEVFKVLDRPILIGLSRKSTIYKTLGITAEEALNGTTVLNTIALMKGGSILRVHDVKEAAEAVKLIKLITDS